MARLYADEDFSRLVVEELRRLGHDVVRAQEAGQGNRRVPDDAVLAFAAAQGRIVISFNRRHFIRLHGQSSGHAGIVVCTRDDDAAALAVRIDAALSQSGLLANRLIRIHRPHRP